MGTISKRKKHLSLLPGSSQLRYAAAYIAITTVVLFFLNIYAANTTRSLIFSAQHRSLEEKAQLMTTALLQLDDLSASKTAQTVNSLEDLRTARTVVTDAAGTVLFDSLKTGNTEGKLLMYPEVVRALEGNDVFHGSYDGSAIESRAAAPVMRGGKVLGAVYLVEYDSERGAIISALQTNFLRISVGLEIAIVLFSLFFSAAFSRRLRGILLSIQNMREGNYSYKIKLRGHDEIDTLAREFNNLAERLNSSEKRRRQFVSDASHELKTPLASIKLLSDSILQNQMDPETEREFIGDIGREADRLGRLSQKLLTLTKLDSSVEDEREILNATPTVEKVLRMLRPLADLREITIEPDLQPRCMLMTMEDDLYQIVFNLVENAIKYNRENGWIGVHLRRKQEDIVLTVEDTGPGIPEEARAHIFERFYRVDKARSRAAGGAGLGLSIVHDMVRRNYGTIGAFAREGGGTRFEVTFPSFDTEEEIE